MNINSVNSAMNQGQCQDLVSRMCLAGDVVASWSLMQEVVGLTLFAVMTNVFVTELAEFIENIKN